MRTPLEIAFNNLPKDETAIQLILEKVAKLEKICDFIVSCRVIIDRPQQTGNPYSVVAIVRLPPENELIVKRESRRGNDQERLPVLVREVFKVLQRQIAGHVDRLRGEVKAHPAQQARLIFQEAAEEEVAAS